MPSPYLKKNLCKLIHMPSGSVGAWDKEDLHILDIGCGNGRNSEYLKSMGYTNVVSLDMAGDYGSRCVIDKNPLPLFAASVDVILANFIFMFLDKGERSRLVGELKRASGNNCVLMVELYPAKDSETPTETSMLELQRELFEAFGWRKVNYSKGKFIAAKE